MSQMKVFIIPFHISSGKPESSFNGCYSRFLIYQKVPHVFAREIEDMESDSDACIPTPDSDEQ